MMEALGKLWEMAGVDKEVRFLMAAQDWSGGRGGERQEELSLSVQRGAHLTTGGRRDIKDRMAPDP